MLFAITVYFQCCRYVVGQQVLSDISLIHSCWKHL